MTPSSWQVRRTKGRRIYTGLSRRQVESALRSGKLTADDLAMPPRADRWMKVSVALVHTGDEAIFAQPIAEVAAAEWAPMEKEGRLVKPEVDDEDPSEMDMTPMIDVTTLLLIFFLVGGVFMLQAAIEMPKAKSGSPQEAAERKPVGIVIEVDAADESGGRISFDGAHDAKVALDDLVKGYREQVEAGAIDEAIIKAHRAVPFALVRRVMAKLTEAGVVRIAIGVEDAPAGRRTEDAP